MSRDNDIFFTTYQAGENGNYRDLEPGEGGRLDRLWDGYDDQGLMEDLKFSGPDIQKFYDARIHNGSSGSGLNNPPPFPQGDSYDVWVIIFFSPEAVQAYKKQFKQFLADTIEVGDNTGADDGTYDYYPDRWYVARQIAEALGMLKYYSRARKKLLAQTQYGREDLQEYIPE